LACIFAHIEVGPIQPPSASSDGEVAVGMSEVHLFVEDVGCGALCGVEVVLEGVVRSPLELRLGVVAHDRIEGYLRLNEFDGALQTGLF
jgi:hypothetical protein